MKCLLLSVQDLRHLKFTGDKNKAWMDFALVLPRLRELREVVFGQCPTTILHTITEKMPDLERLSVDFVADTLEDPQMWWVCSSIGITQCACVTNCVCVRG